MNATEQKQRRTAVQTVEKRVQDVETVVEALNDKVAEVAQVALAAIDDVMEAVGTETEHRVALGAIVRGHQAFVQQTFWQRLRWIAIGR